MATVTVEPLDIGHAKGPRVYIVVRQVGRHKDIEQAPDDVKGVMQAVAWAAKRWNVAESAVHVKTVQLVEVEAATNQTPQYELPFTMEPEDG